MDNDIETLVRTYLPCKPEKRRNMILRIAQKAGVSESTVKRWIRQNGARMDAEWSPPMRVRTKMLVPECEG